MESTPQHVRLAPRMESTPQHMSFRDAQQRVLMDQVKTRMFLLGLGSGTTLTLFIASILLMLASYSPSAGAISVICGWPHPLFRAAFLASLCGLLYGAVVFAWRRNSVDFRRALHLSPAVTYQAILSYSYACFVIVFACFVLFALLLLAPDAAPGLRRFRNTLPLIAFMTPFLVAAWPKDRAPGACLSTPGAAGARRALALERVGPVLVSPFSKVTFARTFVADVLCSMPKIFADALYGFAVVFNCDIKSNAYVQTGYVLAFLPFVVRLNQSLRAALDDAGARRKNCLNAGKYALQIALVGESLRAPHSLPWFALALTSTLCNFFWDVHMDWGLPRQQKRFPQWFYPFAVASNFVLRLGWAVYVSPDQNVVAQHVILLLGVAEVFRRFQWAALRVEHEALKIGSAPNESGGLRYDSIGNATPV